MSSFIRARWWLPTSLKHLTFKTVFLLALGSFKRRGEIHAWLQKTLRHFAPRCLSPSPSFLLKNQLAKECPDSVAPIVILALTPTLDKSLKTDRPLCPARVLLCYLDRSSDLRQKKELFFVSFQKGFDKDIYPIRAFADSKGFQSGVSLEQLHQPVIGNHTTPSHSFT